MKLLFQKRNHCFPTPKVYGRLHRGAGRWVSDLFLKVEGSTGYSEIYRRKLRFFPRRLCQGLVLQGLLSGVSWGGGENAGRGQRASLHWVLYSTRENELRYRYTSLKPTPGFLPGESPWTEEPGGLKVHGVTKSQTRLSGWAHTQARIHPCNSQAGNIPGALLQSQSTEIHPAASTGPALDFPPEGPTWALTAAADPGEHCSTITRQTGADSKPSPGQENLASSRVESKEINIRTNEVFREEIMCGVGRRRGEVFYFLKKKEKKKRSQKVGKFQINHGFPTQTTTHSFFLATIINAVSLKAWLHSTAARPLSSFE